MRSLWPIKKGVQELEFEGWDRFFFVPIDFLLQTCSISFKRLAKNIKSSTELLGYREAKQKTKVTTKLQGS